MLIAKDLTKKFDNITALNSISLEITNQNVFGLIGTNGAGKSTFLKMAAGIIKPDTGVIQIDGKDIFENIEIKEKFFYISDEQFFFNNTTPYELKNFYKQLYKKFDEKRFTNLMKSFGLDEKRKIKTFSKGMKKQVSVICGVCAKTDYIFCDETFDGLDPVVRKVVKSIFMQDMEDRGLTPIIASHNLREIEDICDNVGILHKGGMLLSKDLDNLKLGIHKIQVIFNGEMPDEINQKFEILKQEKRGSLYMLTIRGDSQKIDADLKMLNTVFFERLPLTLEEIFIAETEVVGYDIKELII